ncbi:bifunctional DNA-formamidopyrimidine glycosylase/DNA-(apurinic or apyrimidinic site) lyase [Candidatus Saccharibacteria bacterium]|nr:bifunctional DNA-formamidopyrimidine glycosylase/DNA-(apurinic or apyrimidinic site) lyase [Candidatus Saccharibacteria bacterium]
MPELPEVETIRRGLSKFILKKKLVKVEVLCEKSFVGDKAVVIGKKVMELRRFGKALVIDFEGEKSVMIHLRMTGQLIWQGKERYAAGHPSENFVAELPNKQTRVVFEFEDGKLFFNDQRKFGFCKAMDSSEVEKDEFIKKLAKEPWVMGVEELVEQFKRHKNSVVKAVLLDQSIICGLGNIYADETLFFAGVHPERRAGTISEVEAKKILEGARKVMQESIDSGGSTMATYVKADGTRGDYLEKFAQVFRKEGTPCPKCGTMIKKIRVAGRGTHICPECQK